MKHVNNKYQHESRVFESEYLFIYLEDFKAYLLVAVVKYPINASTTILYLPNMFQS